MNADNYPRLYTLRPIYVDQSGDFQLQLFQQGKCTCRLSVRIIAPFNSIYSVFDFQLSEFKDMLLDMWSFKTLSQSIVLSEGEEITNFQGEYSRSGKFHIIKSYENGQYRVICRDIASTLIPGQVLYSAGNNIFRWECSFEYQFFEDFIRASYSIIWLGREILYLDQIFNSEHPFMWEGLHSTLTDEQYNHRIPLIRQYRFTSIPFYLEEGVYAFLHGVASDKPSPVVCITNFVSNCNPLTIRIDEFEEFIRILQYFHSEVTKPYYKRKGTTFQIDDRDLNVIVRYENQHNFWPIISIQDGTIIKPGDVFEMDRHPWFLQTTIFQLNRLINKLAYFDHLCFMYQASIETL